MTTAYERLEAGYYNSGPVTEENPGGMGDGGHVLNFPLALQDVATVTAQVVLETLTTTGGLLVAGGTVGSGLTLALLPATAGDAVFGTPGRVMTADVMAPLLESIDIRFQDVRDTPFVGHGAIAITGNIVANGVDVSLRTATQGDILLGGTPNRAVTADVLKPILEGKLAISSKASPAEGVAGSNQEKWMTPYATKVAISARITEVASPESAAVEALAELIEDRMDRGFANAEFDETGATGPALGTLVNVDSAVTGTPTQVIADCTGTDLGTNVSTAMAAAINDAVDRIGDGAVISFGPGRRRLGTAQIIDLGGAKDVTIDLGMITPDATAMTALTFRNAYNLTIEAKILGGGKFAGWAAALPFYVDYSTTQDVVGAGGCEAIKIQGVSGYTLNVTAQGYGGRVIRITERASISHPGTIACKGSIRTSRFDDLSLPRVAQALWADDGTKTEHGNWGGLDNLVSDFDFYPPVWVDLNDVAIKRIDGAYSSNGPFFRGVEVLELDSVYVGDVDGNSSNWHLQLVPSGTRPCAEVTYNHMTFLNGGSGLNAVGVKGLRGRPIKMIGASSAFETAARFSNCKDVYVDMAGATAGSTGSTVFFIEGAESDNININVRSNQQTSNHAFITSEVTGHIRINGRLEQAFDGDCLLIISSTTAVVRLNLDLISDDPTSSKLLVPATNKIYWEGGSSKGASGDWGSTARPLYTNTAAIDGY